MANFDSEDRLLAEYRAKYPGAVAFMPSAEDPALSIQQRVLEYSIENISNEINDFRQKTAADRPLRLQPSNIYLDLVHKERAEAAIASHSAPHTSAGDNQWTLPGTHPWQTRNLSERNNDFDILKLREERTLYVERKSYVLGAPPCAFDGDLARHLIELAGAKRNAPKQVQSAATKFLTRKKEQLGRARFLLVRRYARVQGAQQECRSVKLAQQLRTLDDVYASVCEKIAVVSRASAPVQGSASHTTSKPCVLPEEVLHDLIREEIAQAIAEKRTIPFLVRMQWLAYTHRFDIYRRLRNATDSSRGAKRTHDFASASGYRDGGEPIDPAVDGEMPERSPSSAAPGKSKQQEVGDLPMHPNSRDSMLKQLELLSDHFGLRSDPSDEGGYQFAYEASQTFSACHEALNRLSVFPPYSILRDPHQQQEQGTKAEMPCETSNRTTCAQDGRTVIDPANAAPKTSAGSTPNVTPEERGLGATAEGAAAMAAPWLPPPAHDLEGEGSQAVLSVPRSSVLYLSSLLATTAEQKASSQTSIHGEQGDSQATNHSDEPDVRVDIEADAVFVKAASWLRMPIPAPEPDAFQQQQAAAIRLMTARNDKLRSICSSLNEMSESVLCDHFEREAVEQSSARRYAQNALSIALDDKRTPDIIRSDVANLSTSIRGDTKHTNAENVLQERKVRETLGEQEDVARASSGEGTEDEHSGAPKHLALALRKLRHARCRELKIRLLLTLNVLRSYERTMTHDHTATSQPSYSPNVPGQTTQLAGDAMSDGAPREVNARAREFAETSETPFGARQRLDEHETNTDTQHTRPAFKDAVDTDVIDSGTSKYGPFVRDNMGVRVLYDAAIDDLATVEEELLAIGTYYITVAAETSRSVSHTHRIDHAALFEHLLQSAFWFEEAKVRVVEALMQAYEQAVSTEEMRRIARVVQTVLVRRPKYDFSARYFAEGVASDIVALQLRAQLLGEVLTLLEADARDAGKEADDIMSRAAGGTVSSDGTRGDPQKTRGREADSLLCTFNPHIALLLDVSSALDSAVAQLAAAHHVHSALEQTVLERLVFQYALEEWKVLTKLSPLRAVSAHMLHRAVPNTPQGTAERGAKVGTAAANERAVPLSAKPADIARLVEIAAQVAVTPSFSHVLAVVDSAAADAMAGQTGRPHASASATRVQPSVRPEGAEQHLRRNDLLSSTLECIWVQRFLTFCITERMVLESIAAQQAQTCGREPRQLAPVHDPRRADVPGNCVQRPANGPAFVAASFDVSLGSYDFGSFTGLHDLLRTERLDDLRLTCKLEAAEVELLRATVRANQVGVDNYLHTFYAERERAAQHLERATRELADDGTVPPGERARRAQELHDRLEEQVRTVKRASYKAAAETYIRLEDIKREPLEELQTTLDRSGTRQREEASAFDAKLRLRDALRVYSSRIMEKIALIFTRTQICETARSLLLLVRDLPSHGAPFDLSESLHVSPYLRSARMLGKEASAVRTRGINDDNARRFAAADGSRSEAQAIAMIREVTSTNVTRGTTREHRERLGNILTLSSHQKSRGGLSPPDEHDGGADDTDEDDNVDEVAARERVRRLVQERRQERFNEADHEQAEEDNRTSTRYHGTNERIAPSVAQAAASRKRGWVQNYFTSASSQPSNADAARDASDNSAGRSSTMWTLPSVLEFAGLPGEYVTIRESALYLDVLHSLYQLVVLFMHRARVQKGTRAALLHQSSLVTAQYELTRIKREMAAIEADSCPERAMNFLRQSAGVEFLKHALALENAKSYFLENGEEEAAARVQAALDTQCVGYSSVRGCGSHDMSEFPHPMSNTVVFPDRAVRWKRRAEDLQLSELFEGVTERAPHWSGELNTWNLPERRTLPSARSVSTPSLTVDDFAALFLLSDAQWRHLGVELLRVEALLEKSNRPHEQQLLGEPQRALSAERAVLLTHLAVERLKEALACYVMQKSRIETSVDYIAKVNVFASSVLERFDLLEARSHATGENASPVADRARGAQGAVVSTQGTASAHGRFTEYDATHEERVRIQRILRISKEEFHLRILGSVFDHAGREQERALLAQQADHGRGEDESTIGKYHALVTNFLTSLHSYGSISNPTTSNETLNTPAAPFVHAQEFVSEVQSLVMAVSSIARDSLESRCTSQSAVIASMEHMLQEQRARAECALFALRRERALRQRQVEMQVAERHFEMMFECHAMRRRVRELASELRSARSSARADARREYEELVQMLTMRLAVVKAKFSEYRSYYHQEILSHLSEVRNEAMLAIVRRDSAPRELRDLSSKMADAAKETKALQEDKLELEQTVLKLRMMGAVKDLTMRRRFERSIASLEEQRRGASRNTWMHRAEMEHQLVQYRKQVVLLRQQLSATEASGESARKQLERVNRNKQALVQWKIHKTQRMEELERRVQQYERWSHVDVDKLAANLERQTRELDAYKRKGLSSTRNIIPTSASGNAVAEESQGESKLERELHRLQQKLAAETRLKKRAFERLAALSKPEDGGEDADARREHTSTGATLQRNGGHSAGSGIPPLGTNELVGSSIWKRRYYEQRDVARQLDEENARLRAMLAAARAGGDRAHEASRPHSAPGRPLDVPPVQKVRASPSGQSVARRELKRKPQGMAHGSLPRRAASTPPSTTDDDRSPHSLPQVARRAR